VSSRMVKVSAQLAPTWPQSSPATLVAPCPGRTSAGRSLRD